MTRVGLPQLIGVALARAVPDLPAPAPPLWAHLCEAVGLGQALRAAGFTDVAVHPVTHHWRLDDPGLFFRQLPDWTPPLRPLFASLPVRRSTVRPPHSLTSSESNQPGRACRRPP